MPEEVAGGWIKRARMQNGLTQGELATKARVGQPTISNWETGKGAPDEKQKARLEAILGTEVASASANSGALGGPTIAGAWLSKAREQAGLTPAQLARKAGVSIPTIYNIESGRAQFPRRRTVGRLEDALGVHFDRESERELREAGEIEGLGNFEDFDPHDQSDWPEVSGVYMFYDISDRPVYVGRGGNIARRIKDHEEKFWFKRPIVYTASYVPIRDETLMKQVESVLIKFLKSNAVLNQQLVERE